MANSALRRRVGELREAQSVPTTTDSKKVETGGGRVSVLRYPFTAILGIWGLDIV